MTPWHGNAFRIIAFMGKTHQPLVYALQMLNDVELWGFIRCQVAQARLNTKSLLLFEKRQVHLFIQEHERESPGGLQFPANTK